MRGEAVTVHVETVGKTYAARSGASLTRALTQVSFDVCDGEIFGVLGPNGAGKSTLFDLLGGLLEPDAGVIRLRTQVSPGIQRQRDAFFELLSLEENLDLCRVGHHATRSATEALRHVGLAGYHKQRVNELSGGERKRFAIAAAMIRDPKLLLLDEPTSELDPQARYELWGMIRQERERGTTVILSTHLLEEAEALCDRVLILDRGRVQTIGSPRALIDATSGAHSLGDVFRFRTGRQLL